MRSLVKLDKPAILVANEVEWTKAYVLAQGTEAERSAENWRHKEIKETILQEVSNKCAYCESKVTDVSWMDVEHIIPKGKRPELAHVWINLTGACTICNNRKRDYYEAGAEIVNPYIDDIESHLHFSAAATVTWKLGAQRGEITVAKLDLNRMDLVNSRSTRILKVMQPLERWAAASEPLKSVLRESILLDAQEGEYTKSVLSFLESHGFPVQGVDSEVTA